MESGGGDSGACASPPCPTSKIEHVVVIVQENHTFDNYFGNWCKAATGSNPTCTSGASCCEAAPSKDPGTGDAPGVENDAANGGYDPNHEQACELLEIDGGKMDGYISAPQLADAGGTCGSTKNFAYADSTVQAYWNLAQQGALADHYFQPIAGQSSSNDMYLARAQFVFLDNSEEPVAIGDNCSDATTPKIQYTDPTIADLLNAAGVDWAFYAGGYAAMVTATGGNASAPTSSCPAAPSACPLGIATYPCVYDPSDDPFSYYKSLVDDPAHFKDGAALASDLTSGKLPPVAFVKAIGYETEHPGVADLISTGVAFVTQTISAIEASPYASSTLVLLTYDEGGGYFDHVSPPPTSAIDHQPYGTRIPLIATGPFARAGAISHTVMEHSSLVKFIEYNWLGGKTGQLGGRDTVVANIGSMLDPSLGVPEQ